MASQYVIVDRLDKIIDGVDELDKDLVSQAMIIHTEQQSQGEKTRTAIATATSAIVAKEEELRKDITGSLESTNNTLGSMQETLTNTIVESLEKVVESSSTTEVEIGEVNVNMTETNGILRTIKTDTSALKTDTEQIVENTNDLSELLSAINNKIGTYTD